MNFIFFKYIATATIVVIISEVAKRSDRIGAFIASLPIVTFMVLFWLYIEGQTQEKISNHAWYTFWYVIPTLPMFVCFPFFLRYFGFGMTMLISVIITLISFLIITFILKYFGINLF